MLLRLQNNEGHLNLDGSLAVLVDPLALDFAV